MSPFISPLEKSWKAPTNYSHNRASDGGYVWLPVPGGNADEPATTDEVGFTWGQTYYYRVYATNDAGNSGYSAIVPITFTKPCPSCDAAVNSTGDNEDSTDSLDSESNGWNASSTIDNSSTDQSTSTLMSLDGSTDHLTVIDGAGSQQFFDESGGGYVEAYGGTDTLTESGGEYILTTPAGEISRFSDEFEGTDSGPVSKLLSITDPGGNNSHVVSSNAAGDPTEVRVTNSAGDDTEQWLYTYLTTGVNAGMTSTVVQREKHGSSFETTRSLTYTYYDGTTTGGEAGNIASTTIEDRNGNVISSHHYLYYTSGQTGGSAGALKYTFDDASYARLTAAYPSTPFQSLTDAQLAPYAGKYITYDDSNRVVTRTLQGAGCSACAGGQGTSTFAYAYSGNTPGENVWNSKTTQTQPDGNQNVTYYNENGQVLLAVYVDTTTGQMWGHFHEYDSSGREILTADPSAVALPASLSTLEAYPDLLHNVSGNYQYLNDSTGRIQITDYGNTTTASSTAAGNVANYVEDMKIEHGETGSPILQSSEDYIAHSDGDGATVYPTADSSVYRNTDGTGAETTNYAYTWFSNSLQEQTKTTSLPVVTSAQNGPGTADVSTDVYDGYGRVIWHKDADGYLSYTAYNSITGGVTKSITDVNTADTSDFDASTLPTGWTTSSGGGLELITTDQVDDRGRTIEQTDPDGNVTYTVYKDAEVPTTGFINEVRVYPGWHYDSSLGAYTTTGPVQVTRTNDPGSYSESLTYAAPSISTSTPDGSDGIGTIQTLSRSLTSAGGQVVESDKYFNLSGLTYSASSFHLGTANTNYYATAYGYDHNGNQNKVVSPTGTITRTVYDGQNRVISTWVGTNDTPTSGYWSPTNAAGMTEVSSDVYDNGGVGDGDLTQSTQYPNGSTHPRVTQTYYDWRDRAVASKSGVLLNNDGTENLSGESDGTHRPITYTIYDNLDEAIEQDRYDGDGVAVSSSGEVPSAPSASLLRSNSGTKFDNQGRVYRTSVFSVNPVNGNVSSDSIDSNTWYDHRGNVIKTQSNAQAATKTAYDGAGRAVVSYMSDAGGDAAAGATGNWSDAGNVTGDVVLEQDETTYDADGNVIEAAQRNRFNTDTGTGPLGGPTSTNGARVYYTTTYYDAANRPIATANVGTNGGSAYSRTSSIPARSDTVLLTSLTYNPAGWVTQSTDPRGIVTETLYDNAGRTVDTIADYTDGTPTNSSNQTTAYTYDGDDHILTQTAVLPDSDEQETRYIYGVTTAAGSAIDSNDILAETDYPDLDTGEASSDEAETYTVDALGERTSMTDRDGNVHAYTYDVLGRLTSDSATVPGVSGSEALVTAYNSAGQPYLHTTTGTSGGVTGIANQVEDIFNGLGQMIGEYQSHSGAVSIGTTPEVQWGYSTIANGSRKSDLVYPNGRQVDYNYASGLDNSISRLTSESDDSTSTVLESYKYLGAGSVVERDHPENGVNLTYISSTSTGDGGDQYVGLDRFGRVVDQKWVNGSGTAVDEYQYGYDRDGNVLYKLNAVSTANSELYSYDNLNRLITFERGTLNTGHTAISGTPSETESWTLDALGNQTAVTLNGTETDSTYDHQNELTENGTSSLSYDANGNMITDQKDYTYTYDAWNRKLGSDGGPSITHVTRGGLYPTTRGESYTYDALGRRIFDNQVNYGFYYDGWQAIEDRYIGTPTTATNQYVWSPVYVNAMVERDASGTRLYVTQDANWDATAAFTTGGTASQRFLYDPYGSVTRLNGDFTAYSGVVTVELNYLFQGGKLDNDGMYWFEHRDEDPTLGDWAEQDPAGYVDGFNIYRALESSPELHYDPSGLRSPVISYPQPPYGGGQEPLPWSPPEQPGPSTVDSPDEGFSHFMFGGGSDAEFGPAATSYLDSNINPSRIFTAAFARAQCCKSLKFDLSVPDYTQTFDVSSNNFMVDLVGEVVDAGYTATCYTDSERTDDSNGCMVHITIYVHMDVRKWYSFTGKGFGWIGTPYLIYGQLDFVRHEDIYKPAQ